MEFQIDMRLMKPGLKLKGIDAPSIREAQALIVELILSFCQHDKKKYRIVPIVTTPILLEFRILFGGRTVKILMVDAQHKEILNRLR